jgi:hypothetical protein
MAASGAPSSYLWIRERPNRPFGMTTGQHMTMKATAFQHFG